VYNIKKISFIIAVFFIFDNYIVKSESPNNIETIQEDDLPVAHVFPSWYRIKKNITYEGQTHKEKEAMLLIFKNYFDPKYEEYEDLVINGMILDAYPRRSLYDCKVLYSGYIPVEFFKERPKTITVNGKPYKIKFHDESYNPAHFILKAEMIACKRKIKRKMIDALLVLEGF